MKYLVLSDQRTRLPQQMDPFGRSNTSNPDQLETLVNRDVNSQITLGDEDTDSFYIADVTPYGHYSVRFVPCRVDLF